jgi:hypothetical protein
MAFRTQVARGNDPGHPGADYCDVKQFSHSDEGLLMISVLKLTNLENCENQLKLICFSFGNVVGDDKFIYSNTSCYIMLNAGRST